LPPAFEAPFPELTREDPMPLSCLTYRPGDVLRVTDRVGLDHDAIADASGGVIRAKIGRGVVRERLATFDPEGRARVVRHDARRFDHRETLARAEANLGRDGYNLLLDNCQHFASWCATGTRTSHQVETVAIVAGVAATAISLVKVTGIVAIGTVIGGVAAYLGWNAFSGIRETNPPGSVLDEPRAA
jgi:hypothetical protein